MQISAIATEFIHIYDGTPSATLTEHCMFVATNCPGPTIHAMQVNHVIENDIRAAMAGGAISTPQSTQPVSGDVEDLARRAIAGEFGNGDARHAALGDMYSAVQARINENLWWYSIYAIVLY